MSWQSHQLFTADASTSVEAQTAFARAVRRVQNEFRRREANMRGFLFPAMTHAREARGTRSWRNTKPCVHVLDASAMVAFLRDEPGAEVVEASSPVEPPACIAHAVNLCEVFYNFLEASGEDAARVAIDDFVACGPDCSRRHG